MRKLCGWKGQGKPGDGNAARLENNSQNMDRTWKGDSKVLEKWNLEHGPGHAASIPIALQEGVLCGQMESGIQKRGLS